MKRKKREAWRIGLGFFAASLIIPSSLFAAPLLEKSVEEDLGFKVSPEVSITFPQPIEIGIELSGFSDQRLKVFGEFGYLNLPIPNDGVSVSVASAQVGARYFIWNQWFFSLISLGYRTIGMTLDTSRFRIDDTVVADQGLIRLQTLFARIGFGATFQLSKKIGMGMDLGYQFPIFAGARAGLVDFSTSQNSANSGSLLVDSEAIVRVARLGLPQVTLMRLTMSLD